MKKLMLLALFTLFVPAQAFAAFSESDRADFGATNRLKNGGAENGTLGWLESGGQTPLLNSTTANIASGRAAFSWDSNGAGQTLITSGAIGRSLGGDVLACCRFKCATGTCTHTIGITGYVDQTIFSNTTYFVPSCIRYQTLSSETVSITITSVAANEPNLFIDDCRIEPYLGRTFNPLTGGVIEGDTINIASALYTHAEGFTTTASQTGAHAEGQSTTSSGTSSHAEGQGTTASANNAHSEGGNSQATNSNAHAEGNTTIASGAAAHSQGTSTTASGDHATSMGRDSLAALRSEISLSSGQFAAQGDGQGTWLEMKRATTDATATELTLGGGAPSSTTRFLITSGKAYGCSMNLGARQQSGINNKQFLRQFMIENTGGTTALVGTVQTLGTDIGSVGATTWSVTITADDTNDSLSAAVTGVAATNIRWVAQLFCSEIAY